MTSPSSGSEPAVRARGLTRTFADGVGVHGLDLDVEQGTIFGFIGPSGSGKTTTIRLMTGILPPESGELTVLGKSPADFDQADRSRLGYMPQLSVLYPHLSIWENLGFSASLFGVPWRGRRRPDDANSCSWSNWTMPGPAFCGTRRAECKVASPWRQR